MIWRILYIFFKVLLGVLCNREYTFRTWCNKKEAGHILAIYTYLLSISPVITLISTCSRYGIYFIDYMINQYYFFCIKTFHTWLPLFSPFLIHRHISVLYIELFRIMFSCSVLSLAHEKMMQYEEVTDKRC